jgi:Spy/CpxP family protein refolding chaperone
MTLGECRLPRRIAMKRFLILALLAFALVPAAGLAQSPSPYAGFEKRAIKALSDQQIKDLREGLGMSLALAAELNGYPGPRHTLDFANEMNLTDAQRAKVTELFAAMKAESVAIGETLIAQETGLDRQFADKTITSAGLIAATQAIGDMQAALRATHLKYHLLVLEILTPAQVRRYAELRGYAGGEHNPVRQHGSAGASQ